MEATITRRINGTFPATLLDDLERYVRPRKRNQVIVAATAAYVRELKLLAVLKETAACRMMLATPKWRRWRTLTSGCGTSAHRGAANR